jgi:hypothetical protein
MNFVYFTVTQDLISHDKNIHFNFDFNNFYLL